MDHILGDHVHASTSMRGWYSMFVSYFLYIGRGSLKESVPILEAKLDQWDKTHVVNKAATFCKEDLVKFYDMENTPEKLLAKVYSVLALSFAARGCEVKFLKFEESYDNIILLYFQ